MRRLLFCCLCLALLSLTAGCLGRLYGYDEMQWTGNEATIPQDRFSCRERTEVMSLRHYVSSVGLIPRGYAEKTYRECMTHHGHTLASSS